MGLNRHKMFSVLFSNLVLINQARRVGKHIGRPARRRLGRAEIEKIRLLRSQGRSLRQAGKGVRGFPVDDRPTGTQLITKAYSLVLLSRSEERRVGKECRSR